MILADAPAGADLWHQWISVQFDYAHLLSELGFTVVFDFVLGFLFWGKVIKPYLDRRLKTQHDDLDTEHGILNHGAERNVRARTVRPRPKTRTISLHGLERH